MKFVDRDEADRLGGVAAEVLGVDARYHDEFVENEMLIIMCDDDEESFGFVRIDITADGVWEFRSTHGKAVLRTQGCLIEDEDFAQIIKALWKI